MMDTAKLPLSAALLFGPRSRRFGFPKAFLPWDGMSLARHLLEEARDNFSEVLAVAKEPSWVPPDAAKIYPPLLDHWKESGPQAGLVTALFAARNEAVFLTSCNGPHLPHKIAAGMARMAEREGPFDVVVPYIDGEWKPLHALWFRRAMNILQPGRWPNLIEALEQGGLSVCRVSSRELEKMDPGLSGMKGLDTILDWVDAVPPQE